MFLLPRSINQARIGVSRAIVICSFLFFKLGVINFISFYLYYFLQFICAFNFCALNKFDISLFLWAFSKREPVGVFSSVEVQCSGSREHYETTLVIKTQKTFWCTYFRNFLLFEVSVILTFRGLFSCLHRASFQYWNWM